MLPPNTNKSSLESLKFLNIQTIEKYRLLQFNQVTLFSNYCLPIITFPPDSFKVSDLCDYMFSSMSSDSDLVYFDILLSTSPTQSIVADSIKELLSLH